MTAPTGKNITLNVMLKTMLTPGVPILSIREALGQPDQILFLDCREKEEFEVSHLPHALWIGYKDFIIARVDHLPKNATIVIYCSVGKRSDIVTKRLLEAGFTNVKNLVGGIFKWSNHGGQVFRNGNPVSEVHAYNRFWGRWLKKGAVLPKKDEGKKPG